MRKTKIICTLGPATESAEVLHAMIVAGANIFRLNMSHATHDWVRVIVPRIEENLQLEGRVRDRGDATLADLIGVQVDVFTARRERLDAVEAYNTSLIELERIVGGELPAAP